MRRNQQYEEDESVYNLVEHPAPPVVKPPLYRSKYPGTVSAFPKTAKEHIGGGAGDYLTMGRFAEKPDPNTFLKKGQNTAPLPHPAETGSKHAPKPKIKPPIPSKEERPVMGLVSQKNYITANAVDNILAVPKVPVKNGVNYLQKADYGKVPAYLSRVRAQVHEEYRMIAEMQEQQRHEDDQLEVLRDEERQAIVEGLKANWERINKEYQTLSFCLDTPAKKKRKEEYEQMLEQIEQDIKKLSKRFVFVHESNEY